MRPPDLWRPLALLLILVAPAPAAAQTFEISPFGGYRFGGDLFEAAVNQFLDTDGGPVAGAVVNVGMWNGLSFEALASHQWADVDFRPHGFDPPVRVRAVVNQFLAGGRQDFGNRNVRPFMTGLVGLTHYGANGDDEVRFALSGGGGVRVGADHHVQLRMEGRVYTTFVDVFVDSAVCGGGCVGFVHVNVAWQAEFTAGVVFAF
jgi:hypothetical protein